MRSTRTPGSTPGCSTARSRPPHPRIRAPGLRALARGTAVVNGQRLDAGDAAKVEGEAEIAIAKGSGAEVLVFDLPGN